ncbi:chromosome segregation protein SMC [Thiobacter aerophilum]|uniref:Chromosome partition protein Smc n=1 Tax=Thiobacter aerophilum TaxID=3121275 RepID=A0ABV0EB49_9BURK
MRLTHIKLAGFKSFVDPTTIHVPGQLIGIVGPNGCGKSNVIDAVRWVLGESSAKHLRGESMQDVLFNGSGGRKPVSRASVELVFDNSLGRAHGQWSAYAEISVKRVLDRNGDSNYYINNIHVRRRDVTDMFLGTGLGARAYAIIEQGMISRVVEAKPEELRVFLEEAAGVSIYKERRRETELRLRDTRENLLRVDDIRQELAGQLEKLAAQAEVARQYHTLNDQLTASQHMLWFLRKQEAQGQWERMAREVERLVNELEAETARLREAEARLEEARTAHYQASDRLHEVQAQVYAANSEVARIEQQLAHQRDNHARMTQQRAALMERLAQSRARQEAAEAELADWREKLIAAREAVAEAEAAVVQEKAALPVARAAFEAAQQRHLELQKNLTDVEQGRRVEETHYAHAEKTLEQLYGRMSRLEDERSRLEVPDSARLARLRSEVEAASRVLEEARRGYAEMHQRQPELERSLREAQGRVQESVRALAALEARRQALEQMQAAADQDEKLAAWLGRHGLSHLARLWQKLDIANGWDVALEGVLRERVHALVVDDVARAGAWLADLPPAAVVLTEIGSTATPEARADFTPLLQYVRWKGEGGGCLVDWLAGVYAVADCAQALALRDRLAPGEAIVCQAGHVITRNSLSFHGEQSPLHGVLLRQREIEQLAQAIASQRARQGELEQWVEQAEAALASHKTELAARQTEISRMQQAVHQLQLEVQKLTQLEAQAHQRSQAIEDELGEVRAAIEREQAQKLASAEALRELRLRMEELLEHLQDAKHARDEAEEALNRQRNRLGEVERAAQEAVFGERSCAAKVAELENLVRLSREEEERLAAELARLDKELVELDEAPLRTALDAALKARQQAEALQAGARDALAQAAQALQAVEQERAEVERRLGPLRDRLEQARLKEQEARLSNEQAQAQLQEAQADLQTLAAQVKKGVRADHLAREIVRLKQDIEALGAVNLAALEELEAASARKTYLDAQAADLAQAVETLETAIARIDRETRERLQQTYDTVNRYFKELFPSIFRGGHAELILTGDNLLDAGVQIVAQPPGKRNNSLHLLSGGEKALTALALVFSLFRLNPAPFCLLDEVDAPLDDANTLRYCELVKRMSEHTQFLFVTHNKITMEMAQQLIGVTMPEPGVSRVVAVDVDDAMKMQEKAVA